MGIIIDGKKIAQEILAELNAKDGAWRNKFFAAFLVGNNKESESFLRQKAAYAAKAGIDFRIYELPESLSNDALRKKIGTVIKASRCGGGIVQLPIPEKFNDQAILNAIPKAKDPDCLSEQALGGFYTGRGILPPAVQALSRILDAAGVGLQNASVVVIGRGRLIGKPISLWLLDKTKHSHSIFFDPQQKSSQLMDADVIISGMGNPGMIRAEHIRDGAVLIDFGYASVEGKLRGDVDMDSCRTKASIITPTPGGTGPVVVAELFRNFYLLNSK